MQDDNYALKSEDNFTVFEFVSEGPKGAIQKLIHFQALNDLGFYNLAFGDKVADTRDINDLAISNNGDSEKVLATVVSALYVFFNEYPDAFVYAKGSTAGRTRLYRMGITKFYKLAVQDFYLFGQVGDNFYEFEIDKVYSGFLVLRKLA